MRIYSIDFEGESVATYIGFLYIVFVGKWYLYKELERVRGSGRE